MPRPPRAGWLATDNLDREVQSKVVCRGYETINLAVPTATNKPYIISYDVTDFAGGRRAEVPYRWYHVHRR